ncbi:hypothetical protein ATW55_13895 [Ferroacidibacillus organovorans]|uniref:Uncharacterized protein n=2 Tax=Ferroacidibacillus organovorans TaxID=1765683 RepID=A0A101XPX6_9BACL|nr:hypothetical protein ATW55_13895 [Ferroacidibacillus organovorans]
MVLMFELAAKASDVRQNFSEYVDTVVHDQPVFVARNRHLFAWFNPEQLATLLDAVTFHAELERDENGEYIAIFNAIDDIVVRGETREAALRNLAQLMREYAEEYLTTSFKLFFNAPNRRGHFPYVLKIALQASLDDIVGLLHAGD